VFKIVEYVRTEVLTAVLMKI